MDPAVAARMEQHVRDLAREHGVRLRWTSRGWRHAIAFPDTYFAIVPVVRHPSDYLFALHELGHVISPEARTLAHEDSRYADVLCEGAAWAWASEHAAPALTRHLRAKDWNLVAYAFRTYLNPPRAA